MSINEMIFLTVFGIGLIPIMIYILKQIDKMVEKDIERFFKIIKENL